MDFKEGDKVRVTAEGWTITGHSATVTIVGRYIEITLDSNGEDYLMLPEELSTDEGYYYGFLPKI